MAAVRHLAFVIRVWATREGHVVVFITVKNLLGIDRAYSSFDNRQVFRICEFGILRLRLEYAYSVFAPQIFFAGFDPLNWEQSRGDPQKALSGTETRHDVGV